MVQRPAPLSLCETFRLLRTLRRILLDGMSTQTTHFRGAGFTLFRNEGAARGKQRDKGRGELMDELFYWDTGTRI